MTENLTTSKTLSKCRACNSEMLSIVSKRSDFPLYIWPLPFKERTPLEDIYVYICDDCGYIQLQEMTENSISEIYRDEAFNIENIEQLKERFDLITASDEKMFEESKVLEVGGGRNSFLDVLPSSSKKWVSDFSIEENLKADMKGLFIGDFIEIDISEDDFDYIFMFHVLEHFNNPSAAISKARKHLKHNGKIIIEVPNFEYESIYRPDYTIFHMHISLFTEISLLNFMRRNKFNCEILHKRDDVLLAEFSKDSTVRPINHSNDSYKQLQYLDSKMDLCKKNLMEFLVKNENDNIAIFGGGGASTLFLYNYPFMIDHVPFALDNDENKHGRSLCNGKVDIVDPKEIHKLDVKHVIILDKAHIEYVGNYNVNYIDIGTYYEQ
tara:strand:- start:51 stop:1193 length:1143 start_codon:yes stop_codon:yes gene_type:complete